MHPAKNNSGREVGGLSRTGSETLVLFSIEIYLRGTKWVAHYCRGVQDPDWKSSAAQIRQRGTRYRVRFNRQMSTVR